MHFDSLSLQIVWSAGRSVVQGELTFSETAKHVVAILSDLAKTIPHQFFWPSQAVWVEWRSEFSPQTFYIIELANGRLLWSMFFSEYFDMCMCVWLWLLVTRPESTLLVGPDLFVVASRKVLCGGIPCVLETLCQNIKLADRRQRKRNFVDGFTRIKWDFVRKRNFKSIFIN